MSLNNVSKKTMGRRRIEITKIQKKSNLQVTFSKRRNGLFAKASELSVLCGAQIAILVQSPAGKIFTFGHPSVEALIERLERETAPPETARQIIDELGRSDEYKEAVRRLEMEKMRSVDEAWWDQPCEGLELHELEEYLEALEILRGNVLQKLEENDLMKLEDDLDFILSYQDQLPQSSSSSNFMPLPNHDQHVDYDLFELISN